MGKVIDLELYKLRKGKLGLRLKWPEGDFLLSDLIGIDYARPFSDRTIVATFTPDDIRKGIEMLRRQKAQYPYYRSIIPCPSEDK